MRRWDYQRHNPAFQLYREGGEFVGSPSDNVFLRGFRGVGEHIAENCTGRVIGTESKGAAVD